MTRTELAKGTPWKVQQNLRAMFTNLPSPAPRCKETHRCDTTGLSDGDGILQDFGDNPEGTLGSHIPFRVSPRMSAV